MIQPRAEQIALRLKLTLQDVDPEIWRVILVDERSVLSDLHRVFQVAMGWLDYHLYEFEIAGTRYEDPDPEAEGESATLVVLEDLEFDADDSFLYRYDFGDAWEIRVEVGGREEFDRNAWLPAIVDGERAGPPEDAGGSGGMMDLLEAISDPSHPEHEEYRMWAGENYRPEVFDIRAANHFLWLAVGWGVIGPEADFV